MKKKKQKHKSSKFLRFLVILIILIVGCYFYYTESAEKKIMPLSSEEVENPFLLGNRKGSGLELPASIKGHQVVSHTGYTLSYNEEYEVADWVAYEFTNEELNTQVAERNDNFRADSDILTKSAQLSDYRGSGYSRGHLAPAADFKWSDEAMSDTFYLSNMTPQKQDNFNAGIWLKAEDYVRDLCHDNDVVYVVSGPVLTDGPYETIGKNNVAVPKQFYKVLIAVDSSGLCKAVGMIIPHDAERNSELSSFFCSINEVEEITGLDFFPLLEDNIEEIIENSVL